MIKYSSSVILQAVLRQLRSDADKDLEYLERRNTIICEKIGSSSNDYTLLTKWLLQLNPTFLTEFARQERLVFRIAQLLGALFGVLASVGVVWIDGARPVNVITVLLILVAIPGLLLLCTVVFVMPSQSLRWLPIYASISDFFLRIVPHDQVRRGLVALGVSSAQGSEVLRIPQSPLRRRYMVWTATRFAQALALAYSLAACLTMLLLFAVSDVAFVWSTTLHIDEQAFQEFLALMARPWASFIPEAVPSLSLIELTRYYRMKRIYLQPELFSAWWPFLLCAIFFYGVLPRTVLLLLSSWRRDVAARRLLWTTPGVELHLNRMKSAGVETSKVESPEAEQLLASQKGASGREIASENMEASENAERAFRVFEPEDELIVLLWAMGMSSELVERVSTRFAGKIKEMYHVGGKRLLSQDTELLTQLGQQKECTHSALFVRGWEPPTAELLSFVEQFLALRSKGLTLHLVVMPLSKESALSQLQCKIWQDLLGGSISLEVFEYE